MTFETSLADTVRTLESLAQIRPAVDTAAGLVLATLRGGGKILTCGNGGSAAEASHLATELVGRYGKERKSLAAVALAADGAAVTCIGNDFGFDRVFARQLSGLGRPGDLLIAITSSGNSPNIVAAIQEARLMGIKSVAMLGRGGGNAKGLATVDLIVPGARGATAQEAHLFLIHYFCELVDESFK